jgi:hypothetical protein
MKIHLVVTVFSGVLDEAIAFQNEKDAIALETELRKEWDGSEKLDITRLEIEVKESSDL